MSVEALTWAKKAKVGNSTKKAILMVLADYADEKWSCFPSQATIADEAEVSVRTVQRILNEWDGTLIRRQKRGSENGGRTSDRIFLLRGNTTSCQGGKATSATELGDNRAEVTRQSLSQEPPENRQGTKEHSGEFEQWWSLYPKKEGKGAARRKFDKVRASGVPLSDLIDGLHRYLDMLDRNRWRNPKLPTTWLNQETWADSWDEEEAQRQHDYFNPPSVKFG